jgi:hypothetical protein
MVGYPETSRSKLWRNAVHREEPRVTRVRDDQASNSSERSMVGVHLVSGGRGRYYYVERKVRRGSGVSAR